MYPLLYYKFLCFYFILYTICVVLIPSVFVFLLQLQQHIPKLLDPLPHPTSQHRLLASIPKKRPQLPILNLHPLPILLQIIEMKF